MKVRFCYSLLFLLSVVNVFAQDTVTYRTAKLHAMAKQLPEVDFNTLPIGESLNLSYEGHPLVVRVNRWKEVEHIGYRLFDVSRKDAAFSLVYDFLERYFLELSLPLEMDCELRMSLDKVCLEVGTLERIFQLEGTEIFRIEFMNMRKYRVAWYKEGKEFLVFSFDMDYQLLAGSDAVELEYLFGREFYRFIEEKKSDKVQTSRRNYSSSSKYHIEEGECYLVDAIRNDLYFENVSGSWQLVCDTSKLYWSANNIMLSAETPGEYELDMAMDLFGYKTASGSLKWEDLLSFCRAEGCRIFFGIKRRDKDAVLGTVFMANEKKGYNHMLSVKIPIQTIADRKGILTGRLYVYIPLHNVSARFLDFDYYQKKLIE